MRKKGLYERFFKRFLDILLSLIALVLFWWLILIIAILVRFKLGSPILFKQPRPGLGEKIFKMYKFRSMSDKKDAEGNLLPDSKRVTKFGRLLRSSSLDELPELFNILKGDMSIVGPRPLLKEYLPYYKPDERLRHSVRPGLTGLAQVNGRNSGTWEKKFELDNYYVRNISFSHDVKILFKTVIKTIKRSDILLGDEIPARRLDHYRRKK